MVDHVSDSFLEPDNPLLLLIRAAQEVMGCFVFTLARIGFLMYHMQALTLIYVMPVKDIGT